MLIAGGAAVAAALGGLLLDDGVEDVEKAVQTGNIPGLNLATAPLDESTKLALKVAVGLLVVVGVTAGAGSVLEPSEFPLRGGTTLHASMPSSGCIAMP